MISVGTKVTGLIAVPDGRPDNVGTSTLLNPVGEYKVHDAACAVGIPASSTVAADPSNASPNVEILRR
jgi:hypothetical protein